MLEETELFVQRAFKTGEVVSQMMHVMEVNIIRINR